MSPLAGPVCPSCRGTGRVRTWGGFERCRDCRPLSAAELRDAERVQALDGLWRCWRAYDDGLTGALNLELAAHRAERAGVSRETLIELGSMHGHQLAALKQISIWSEVISD